MANLSIVSQEEILTYLGLTSTSANQKQIALALFLAPLCEAAVKDYLQFDVVAASYVEILPPYAPDLVIDEFADVDAQQSIWFEASGGGVYPRRGNTSALELKQIPVTGITEVRMNPTAYGVASAFTNDTIISASGYRFDIKGYLYGVAITWPASWGSVMVTYTAGLTANQLNGRYGAIKLGVLETLKVRFQNQLSSAGPVISERWPDYSVTYASTGAKAGQAVAVPASAKEYLDPYVRYRL
jgi:hypothetical protein